LRHETPAPLAALAGLITLAAGDELVLVGTHHMLPQNRLPALRRALEPRQMVVLLVDDHVPSTERALVEDLLNDGIIPVILTSCDPPPPALTGWLSADSRPLSTPLSTSHRRPW
jgi:hypothetical protein